MAVAVDVVALSLAAGEGEDRSLVALVARRPADELLQGATASGSTASGSTASGSPAAQSPWALPGGRVSDDEDLEQAARRWLAVRGGLSRVRHLEQLATFGAPDRDPRGRVVSVSYLALLPEPPAVGPDAAWHPVRELPRLAYDHDVILASARARLRSKLAYSNVAYGLLPDEFTLRELQAIYEAVGGRPIDKRNFRKKVLALGMLDTAPGQRRGPHRPAQLYRFARPGLALLDDVIPT